MNSDQKLVAMLGLLLLIVVIFTTYRSYLQAVFFQSPTQPAQKPAAGSGWTSSGKLPGSPANSKWRGNPIGGSRFGMPTG